MGLYLKCVKRAVLLIAIASFNSPNLYSQFGMSVAYSTDKVLGLNVFYEKDNDSFYFGFSQQSSSIKNTVVRERKWNYGLTPLGSGDFYWMLDFGYSRKLYNRIVFQPELSIGSKNYYTNYSDRRFKDDGYTLINSSETIAGIGLNFGYIIKNCIEPFCGVNTIKEISFGLRIHFNDSFFEIL